MEDLGPDQNLTRDAALTARNAGPATRSVSTAQSRSLNVGSLRFCFEPWKRLPSLLVGYARYALNGRLRGKGRR
jgi:hypothetical protein